VTIQGQYEAGSVAVEGVPTYDFLMRICVMVKEEEQARFSGGEVDLN
jgi:hypothetical protein